MPRMGYAALTEDDAPAIAACLKTLPPVADDVPGPFGPGEPTGGFVMKVVAPPCPEPHPQPSPATVFPVLPVRAHPPPPCAARSFPAPLSS